MFAVFTTLSSATTASSFGGVTMSMLSIKSRVKSSITGLEGADSNTDTVVAW